MMAQQIVIGEAGGIYTTFTEIKLIILIPQQRQETTS
jgi:hypothetical protein